MPRQTLWMAHSRHFSQISRSTSKLTSPRRRRTISISFASCPPRRSLFTPSRIMPNWIIRLARSQHPTAHFLYQATVQASLKSASTRSWIMRQHQRASSRLRFKSTRSNTRVTTSYSSKTPIRSRPVWCWTRSTTNRRSGASRIRTCRTHCSIWACRTCSSMAPPISRSHSKIDP